MAINSRTKGKVGELEACKSLHETLGLTCRRSQQHCATDSASDIIVDETPTLWWEIKRVQRMNVASVMERSKKDCGNKHPVLLHRPNRSEWLVTVYLSDLPAVCHALQESQRIRAVSETPVSGSDEVPHLGRTAE